MTYSVPHVGRTSVVGPSQVGGSLELAERSRGYAMGRGHSSGVVLIDPAFDARPGHHVAPPSLELADLRLGQPHRVRLQRLGIRGHVDGMARDLAVSTLTLALCLAAGLVAAQFLHVPDRGRLFAVFAVAVAVGWVGSVISRDAIGWAMAHRGEIVRKLLFAWLGLVTGAGLLAVAVGVLLLPKLVPTHSPASLAAERLFLLAILGVVAVDVLCDLAFGRLRQGGDLDWGTLWLGRRGRRSRAQETALRLIAAVAIAAIFVATATLHDFGVGSAFAINCVIYALPLLAAATIAGRRFSTLQTSPSSSTAQQQLI